MQVKEKLTPFGMLKAFNLVMDKTTGNSKVPAYRHTLAVKAWSSRAVVTLPLDSCSCFCFCPVLSCYVQHCPARLSCSAVPCPALPCPALPCPALLHWVQVSDLKFESALQQACCVCTCRHCAHQPVAWLTYLEAVSADVSTILLSAFRAMLSVSTSIQR